MAHGPKTLMRVFAEEAKKEEAEAASKIIEALRQFDEEARRRIIRTAATFYNLGKVER